MSSLSCNKDEQGFCITNEKLVEGQTAATTTHSYNFQFLTQKHRTEKAAPMTWHHKNHYFTRACANLPENQVDLPAGNHEDGNEEVRVVDVLMIYILGSNTAKMLLPQHL
jgi:hypothetical protein